MAVDKNQADKKGMKATAQPTPPAVKEVTLGEVLADPKVVTQAPATTKTPKLSFAEQMVKEGKVPGIVYTDPTSNKPFKVVQHGEYSYINGAGNPVTVKAHVEVVWLDAERLKAAEQAKIAKEKARAEAKAKADQKAKEDAEAKAKAAQPTK